MKVLIAGDFCPQGRVADAFDCQDYESVLGDVRNITSSANYSIVNLECPLVTGKADPIEKIGPNLYCSLNGLEAIKWAGFDCVTLANNHFLDYGACGVRDTIDYLKKNSIDFVGGGENLKKASQILYKEIAGKRLAIINCCEHEFSLATDKTAGSNPLNPVKQFYEIMEAKTHADYVLVIVHGGPEHFQLPSKCMVETYRFFVDAGADAVVNHHQHCFSGYEIYKDRPVFYGLGNFCFDNPNKRNGLWTEGYAVTIDFSTENVSFSIHPFIQCANLSSVILLSQDAYSKRISELNSLIRNDEALIGKLDTYYQSCSLQYENLFEPILNRYYLGAKRRGWLPSFISKKKKLLLENFILCESHRDKIFWWLNLRTK